MAAESITEPKLLASIDLASHLLRQGSPLVAAFWDYDYDDQNWSLVLVPKSSNDQRQLIEEASTLFVEQPYRSVFSLADPVIDSHRIDRARALGSHIRVEPYVGRRLDTTFTGGQYFESVIPVYLAPELMTHLALA